MINRGSKILSSIFEQGVSHLLHEHPNDREHGDARVLYLALAEFLHVNRTELFAIDVNVNRRVGGRDED